VKRVWGNAFQAEIGAELEPALRAQLTAELAPQLLAELRPRLEAELRAALEPELHVAWEERFWRAYLQRDRPPDELAVDGTPASDVLFDRLDDADVEQIRALVRAEPDHRWSADDDSGAAHRVLLHLGVWKSVPAATEKTGLRAVTPPEDVHAMARGPFAAGGGLYEADMIAAAFTSAGLDPAQLGRVLDFGCSSGRAVRVLQAAYPHNDWLGCDPNGPAIDWARENLPGIEFFQSGDHPPLPLADASLDGAYAISIWSHFEPALGLKWFDEMHRLIRPEGHLVVTTHGQTTVEACLRVEQRSWQQSGEIARGMQSRGTWYAAEFGDVGDWGVMNPDWGTAFLDPDWLLAELTPKWRTIEFAAGRNQGNQDVYVLQRA
jgi:SAM-dependent methyltransferase